MTVSIYIGYDARQMDAYSVCRASVRRHLSFHEGSMVPIGALALDDVRQDKLYWRKTTTKRRGNQLWDVISDAPMATEFAISRFLTPHLARRGLALFMDSDMLARVDLMDLFRLVDPKHAVTCVKHKHEPVPGVKMDGQMQTFYARKNWSSLMVFNCDHPSNRALTLDLINSVLGRDLHRFCWLNDSEIGELPAEWNFLVGHSDPSIDPKIVHFTDGTPFMKGYENAPYADEWFSVARGAHMQEGKRRAG